MQLSFGQETPRVMNVRAEGIGTISRYVWYTELYPQNLVELPFYHCYVHD